MKPIYFRPFIYRGYITLFIAGRGPSCGCLKKFWGNTFGWSELINCLKCCLMGCLVFTFFGEKKFGWSELLLLVQKSCITWDVTEIPCKYWDKLPTSTVDRRISEPSVLTIDLPSVGILFK